jgi:hypothetical protein
MEKRALAVGRDQDDRSRRLYTVCTSQTTGVHLLLFQCVQDKIAKTVATDLPQDTARYVKSGKVDAYVGSTPTRVQFQLINGHHQSAFGHTVHRSRNDVGTHNTQDHDLAATHDTLLMGRPAGGGDLPAQSTIASYAC